MGNVKPTETGPLEVTTSEGDVVILGPDGHGGSLTPDAARRSARRLENAADAAAFRTGSPEQEGD